MVLAKLFPLGICVSLAKIQRIKLLHQVLPYLLMLFLCFINKLTIAQNYYTRFFSLQRLRIAYVLEGNCSESRILPISFSKEPYWGGTFQHLIDTFGYGEMFFEMYDSTSNELIYSRGFSCLYNEWRQTLEAEKERRSFIESLVVPFPLKTVKIEFSIRETDQKFNPIWQQWYNPNLNCYTFLDYNPEKEIRSLIYNGASERKVDIVFIAEGYSNLEKEQFFSDAMHYSNVLTSWKPYCYQKQSFNFWSVYIPSIESGSDIPRDTIYAGTALESSYNTLGSDRSLYIQNILEVRKAVAEVPYDQICVLVNTNKYGGGGIYNSLTVFSAHNNESEFLFQHEFGHAFAALADEYFTSPVPYDSSLIDSIEPYQPNITTLVNFDSKWKDLLSEHIPVPTPDDSLYYLSVGVFEGAAYRAKGIYRPAHNCSMKSVLVDGFCPVCQQAINRMIEFYTQK